MLDNFKELIKKFKKEKSTDAIQRAIFRARALIAY